MVKYTPMIEQYLHIKNQYQDCILFFRLGDFYEMFFEDAKITSQILNIALTGRDAGQADRIPMCGIPYHALDNYLSKLVEKGLKVAICEQLENPTEAKGVVKRDVVRIITPGTVMEEKMLQDKNNHFISCMIQHQDSYGLAAADITTGDLFVCSLDNSTLKRVMDEMMSFAPKEVIIIEENKEWEKLLEDTSIYTTQLYKNTNKCFQPLQTFIQHFQERINIHLFHEVEKLAVGWLLEYIYLTQKRDCQHFNQIQRYIPNDKMLLDGNAKRNLELIETIRTKEKKGSLLWILDKTHTSIGGRMLRSWVENPLQSLSHIESRLDAVEELSNNYCLLSEIKDQLKNVYDIERIMGKLAYGNANARDLAALSKSLLIVPMVKNTIYHCEAKLLKDMNEKLIDISALTDILEKALTEEPPISVKDGGMIREGYYELLDQYKNTSKIGKDWILNLEKEERDKTNIKSLKVGYNKVFGYYIEVTKSNITSVPDYYERKQTLANAERYITPELKEQEDLILKAEERLIDLEYQIFTELRLLAIEYLPQIQTIAKAIATIDVLQSLAFVRLENQYIKPSFNTDGLLEITQGRHPVVEKVLKNEQYVANDVLLNSADHQIQLITGPNMAGKSTYMRQVALIVIMAQIGSFVPAESANLSIVDRIFTRIGASDDLASGQSTFMVEMVEAKDAINEATNRSLILLDEIGRGTSTYDGMALAHSLIEYIHNHIHAKTLFSTHYHELTSLENSLVKLKNYHASCMEKDNKVIFLRRIIRGKADKSYGIHVAEIAGMPKGVIDRAKYLLQDYESNDVKHEAEIKPTEERTSSMQLSFLDSHTNLYLDIIETLQKADIHRMTPLDALNLLHGLQTKIKN
ncbi:DNA mismatch repair protein MutS [Desulfuribacillus stibiiarsenatis]|uniref:DNA mismatch repair protein MutS n=1 Tax=Desulfuribacillus stibiiarsenatis TaxID=1390249 RepID=A0A1E5L3W4_9FIRM|nr:DNA mismatch repair protein MutS [Desulfuribacillus stibiiarsenatis]OEH84795.1 DNA mismatch repair protein MutS [Desulfuribacillus stibiiarsenatis]